MNEIYTTHLPYVCISPEWGKFMNVCLILKADVRLEIISCQHHRLEELHHISTIVLGAVHSNISVF